MDQGRFGNVVCSNLGDCSAFPARYDGGAGSTLHIRGLYLLQSQRAMGLDVFTLMTTFHGEMFIGFTFTEPLVSTQQGNEFVQQFKSILEEIASEAP
jgi:hypothetical protein